MMARPITPSTATKLLRKRRMGCTGVIGCFLRGVRLSDEGVALEVVEGLDEDDSDLLCVRDGLREGKGKGGDVLGIGEVR